MAYGAFSNIKANSSFNAFGSVRSYSKAIVLRILRNICVTVQQVTFGVVEKENNVKVRRALLLNSK